MTSMPVANLVAKRFNTEHHILQADEACAAYMTDGRAAL